VIGGAEEIDNYFKTSSGIGSHGIDLHNVDEYDYFVGLITGAFDLQAKRKHRKDTIITFNYDLVCEGALSHLGYRANYHLPPEGVDDQRSTTRRNPAICSSSMARRTGEYAAPAVKEL
jgi:hypothetical protein